MKALKSLHPLLYASGYLFPLATAAGIFLGGWFWSWSAILLAYVFIPAVELLSPAPTGNVDEGARRSMESRRIYDFVLYLSVPVQFGILFLFLYAVSQHWYADGVELAGWVAGTGLCCGAFGINAAHELGHRPKRREKFMSQALLLTSLYMHFFIEHNRGHHRHVSTPADPATSRRGEIVYAFWLRSVIGGFVSAWRIEAKRLRNLGRAPYGLENQMWLFVLMQLAFATGIFALLGTAAGLAFVGVAVIGFLLLETINYIEHYGLMREFNTERNRYEKVQPKHSWNSNHPLGRIVLFELPRHSDHHAFAERRYQGLRHFDESPQLPSGYPGMMLVALVPPLWFFVMHRKMDQLAAAPAALPAAA